MLQDYNAVSESLTLNFTQLSSTVLDIQLAAESSFRMPLHLEPFRGAYESAPSDDDEFKYEVQVSNDTIEVRRKHTQETVFSLGNLTHSALYQEFTTELCTPHLFGLGDRNQKHFRIHEGLYTLYAKDNNHNDLDDGRPPVMYTLPPYS